MKSFDQDQLAGTFRSNTSINGSDCSPLEGEVGDDGVWRAYYPCGLIANSIFNDTIHSPVLLDPSGSSASNVSYHMPTKGTSWNSDADLYAEVTPGNPYNYGDVVPPPNWRQQYPAYNSTFPFPNLNTNDHFQVWMRTAGLPTFSKLYRRNDDEAMAVGRYQIDIYDCESA